MPLSADLVSLGAEESEGGVVHLWAGDAELEFAGKVYRPARGLVLEVDVTPTAAGSSAPPSARIRLGGLPGAVMRDIARNTGAGYPAAVRAVWSPDGVHWSQVGSWEGRLVAAAASGGHWDATIESPAAGARESGARYGPILPGGGDRALDVVQPVEPESLDWGPP